MSFCEIRTQIIEYKPEWTTGCQSDPDSYFSNEISNKGVTVETKQIADPILNVFFWMIIENAAVETVKIETCTYEDKWPDAWGKTRTLKVLTYSKDSRLLPTDLFPVTIDCNKCLSRQAHSFNSEICDQVDKYYNQIKSSLPGSFSLRIDIQLESWKTKKIV